MLVKDIVPGPASSAPTPHGSAGGLLFFRATEAATGRELWRSDGTEAGTMLVQEIVPGPGSPTLGTHDSFHNIGDRLVFRADDGVHGMEMWASDGFAVNLVADINPGPARSIPAVFFISGTASGLLLVGADDGLHGIEMWASDGQSTTRLIQDIATGASSTPTQFLAAGQTSSSRPTTTRRARSSGQSRGPLCFTSSIVADLLPVTRTSRQCPVHRGRHVAESSSLLRGSRPTIWTGNCRRRWRSHSNCRYENRLIAAPSGRDELHL